MLIGLLILGVLVAATSFFVASEFALVSVRMTRIEQLSSEGNSGARQVKRAINDLQSYIAATQVGITMAALGLGAYGEPVISEILLPVLQLVLPEDIVKGFVSVHGVAFVISYLLVTVIEIVFGELVPKIWARQSAERTVLLLIRPLNFFVFIFKPLIWVVNTLGNAVLRLIRMPATNEHSSVHSVEELEMLVMSSGQAGVLEKEEEAILRRVFDLGDLTVRQVMLPRTEMTAIPVGASLPEVIEAMRREKHSRFPVYEGDVDNLLGVLHVKDVFLALAGQIDRQPEDRAADLLAHDFSVSALMRDIMRVPETLDVNDLLSEMQNSGTHMAAVIDEYGGTAGIVTLEDVVEEIVGELHDEFEGNDEKPDIVVTPEGTYVQGMTPIDDLKERLDLKINSESDTVGGYVFEMLGRKPELGDEISANGYIMRVEELDGLRISRVSIRSSQNSYTPMTVEDE